MTPEFTPSTFTLPAAEACLRARGESEGKHQSNGSNCQYVGSAI